MKKSIIESIGRLILMLGLVLIFSRCETDLNGMDQEETNNAAVTLRGGGPGNQGLTVDELCDKLEANYPKEALTADEKEALLFMREEEKLARDVYLALGKKWNIQIFKNISQSEQRHMDAVGCLIGKYDLKDPVGDNKEGKFKNNDLQKLYTTLMAEGSASLIAGLKAGAKIEDLDLFDLDRLAPKTDNQDIQAVFGDLAKGSRNHLRAFINNLERQNATYTPLYLSKETFDAILTAEHEVCGVICDGVCQNGGSGRGRNAAGCNGTGQRLRDGTGQGCVGAGLGPRTGAGQGPRSNRTGQNFRRGRS